MNHSATLHEGDRPRDFRARLKRGPRSLGRARVRRRGGRSLAALALAIGVPAFAAPAEWMGLPVLAGQAPETVSPMGFETPGESFPGSAFYYLEDVPYLPAGSAQEDGGEDREGVLPAGPAARPMVIGGSPLDKARALQCLTMAIYYEAAGESDAGQRAVAQVVLNRVAHPAYPSSVCGVVFQGSERATGCQFTFTCDGSLARQPSRRFWERARKVAIAALAGAVYRPIGLATHYHTVWIHPYWADSLSHVGTIGAHRFYRWQGPAGLPSAFTAAYAGNEPPPMPRPQGREAPPALTDPVLLARAYGQSAAFPATDAPRPSAGSFPEAGTIGDSARFTTPRLPESGSVREEYARSGQWIAQP